jgi:hypothetical protein
MKIVFVLWVTLLGVMPLYAEILISSDPEISLFGQVGNRVEYDHVEGDRGLERTRFRVIGQLGLNYHATSQLTFQAALRTGNEDAANSSGVTYYQVDGGNYGEQTIWPEIYQLIWAEEAAELRLGRMEFPFFQPTPPLWDGDATILGGFAELATGQPGHPATSGSKGGLVHTQGHLRHKIRAGGFMLPDGTWRLSGQLAGAQYELDWGLDDHSAWRTALGFYQIFGEENSAYQNDLVDGLDYSILNLSTRYSSRLPGGGLPWALSADVYYNLNDPDLSFGGRTPRDYKNEQWGFVVRAEIGRNKEPGDVSFGYTYAYVGKFAVNEIYSVDSYSARLRSDYQGHELRLKYTITPNLGMQARAGFFDSLSRSSDSTRLRLDMVWSF